MLDLRRAVTRVRTRILLMDQKKQLSDEVIVEKSRSDRKEHPSLIRGRSTNTTTFAIVAIDCILERQTSDLYLIAII